jgi:gluconate 5-dehydrogenase
MDRFRLDGKTALVTGGSRGIGLGIARAMAAAGADIVLVSRSKAKLEAAAADLGHTGREIRTYPFDVRRTDDIGAFYGHVVSEAGGVDILVNNAGTIVRGGAESVSPEDFNAIVETNLTAVFTLCQAFANEHIRLQTPGKIVNITSIMSEIARPGATVYAMTKGGMRQLTRGLAVDWARHRIHVNAIGPGFTRTDLTAPLWNNPEFMDAVSRRTPLGRWGSPEDIGAAAVFLASAAADFITGQTIYVDGGLMSTLGDFP